MILQEGNYDPTSQQLQTIFLPLTKLRLFALDYVIKNHGQTPADEMISFARVEVLPYPLPPNWLFPVPPVNSRGSKSVLYADEPEFSRTWMKRVLTKEEIIQVVEGEKFRIYIYGVIRYFDIFWQPHQTRFCYSVIGGSNLAAVVSGTKIDVLDDMLFEASDQHNNFT